MSAALPSDPLASAPIDVPRVRRLFAHPEAVAESTFLRREISQRMRERLELVRLEPQRILDAGCGEGGDLPMLRQLYAAPHVLGVDGAPGMLGEARQQQQAALSAFNRVMQKWLPASRRASQMAPASLACADMARLPLSGSCLDLVWSNLALHWHPRPDLVFAEWRRVLQVEGLLMFSCFGPDTFREVRAALGAAGAEAATHVLPFVDMHDFGDQLVEAGFSTPVMDMEILTVTYPNADKLLADIRALGGNPLSTRPQGLMGKAVWDAVRAALAQQAQADGRLPLTFEIIYGHAFRPAPRQTSSGDAILRFERMPKRA